MRKLLLGALLLPSLTGAVEPPAGPSIFAFSLPGRRPAPSDRIARIAKLLAADKPLGRVAPIDLSPGIARANSLFLEGNVNAAAPVFDAAIAEGCRFPHRLTDPEALVAAMVTRASIALSRGERDRTEELLRRLLAWDPAFELLPDERRPQLQALLTRLRSRLSEATLQPDDLGEACRAADVVIAARGRAELWRFDGCRATARAAIAEALDDDVVARQLAASRAAPAADSPRSESEARAHFEVGQGFYHLGNFRDAIREFLAGYERVPKPEFLLNLGQAHRMLGERGWARDYYRRFLAETSPSDPRRRDVGRLLAQLDLEEADERVRPVPKEAPVALPAVPAARPAALRRSAWRRPITWIAIVGGAALVAAGVTTGYVLATQPLEPNISVVLP